MFIRFLCYSEIPVSLFYGVRTKISDSAVRPLDNDSNGSDLDTFSDVDVDDDVEDPDFTYNNNLSGKLNRVYIYLSVIYVFRF